MGYLYIGFGSNRRDRKEHLKKALLCLRKGNFVLDRCSSVYATEGVDSGRNMPEFLNMVASFETILSPAEVLSHCQQVEKSMGRKKDSGFPRIIDLDILFYGSLILCENSLILPHPLAHRRRFVVVPMCEIAPDFVHPVMNITMKELMDKIPENTGYVRNIGTII